MDAPLESFQINHPMIRQYYSVGFPGGSTSRDRDSEVGFPTRNWQLVYSNHIGLWHQVRRPFCQVLLKDALTQPTDNLD
ncbi:unnamed protein product [Urochloa humidicola]